MKNKWKWLAVSVIATVALVGYYLWPKGVSDFSNREREPEFVEYLEGLEMRVELGNCTTEDVEIAQEKLYEIAEVVDTLDIPSDNVRIINHNFGDTYIISKTYSHDLFFADIGSNGMIIGTPDYVKVGNQSSFFGINSRGYFFDDAHQINLEEWDEDVNNLIGDYEQTLVVDYMKLLQYSDNGVVKIGIKKFNLLE